MARRSDNTREELKRMAISAGLKLLDEGGLPALGARKVTREIGYTIGTLYQIFDNYNDLILHMRGVVLDDLQKLLRESVNNTHSTHSNITSLAKAYLGFAQKSYPRWHILFSQPDQPSDVLPEWYKEKLKALFMVIEQALLPLLGKHIRHVQEEAKILWAGVHGICVLSVTQKLERVGSKPAEELIDRFLRNYICAIG